MAENSISDIFSESIGKLREFADAETVIGSPIRLDNGTNIIPVSKVSMGFASGGLDFPRRADVPHKSKNFGGGGGTGVSITPVAFLVSEATGKISLIPITSPQNIGTVDKIASLIERSPDIIGELREALTSERIKDERAMRAFNKAEQDNSTISS